MHARLQINPINSRQGCVLFILWCYYNLTAKGKGASGLEYKGCIFYLNRPGAHIAHINIKGYLIKLKSRLFINKELPVILFLSLREMRLFGLNLSAPVANLYQNDRVKHKFQPQVLFLPDLYPTFGHPGQHLLLQLLVFTLPHHLPPTQRTPDIYQLCLQEAYRAERVPAVSL